MSERKQVVCVAKSEMGLVSLVMLIVLSKRQAPKQRAQQARSEEEARVPAGRGRGGGGGREEQRVEGRSRGITASRVGVVMDYGFSGLFTVQ